jgi:hypothetical protein
MSGNLFVHIVNDESTIWLLSELLPARSILGKSRVSQRIARVSERFWPDLPNAMLAPRIACDRR